MSQSVWWVVSSLSLLAVTASPHAAETTPAGTVEAHFVRLAGKSTENMLRKIYTDARDRCRQSLHLDPGELPTDGPVTQFEVRVYYARQVSITYNKSNGVFLSGTCVTFQRKVTRDKATIKSPRGVCNIDFRERTAKGAKGSCHVEDLLGATQEIQPKVETREQHLGSRTVAGKSCELFRFMYGGMQTDRCVRVPTGFSPYRDDIAPFSKPAGLLLMYKTVVPAKDNPDDAIPYLEAQEVQENIRVPKDIFLPHFARGFSVSDGGE